nr:unnamed protein product [Callosobruchus analis]
MVNCIYCSTAVSRTRPAVFCEACKKNAHTSCVSKSIDILHVINNVPGTSWKCDDCRNNCLCIKENNINAVLDTKVESSLDHIRSEIESIRKDILSQTVKKVQPPADPPRYSDVLHNKTQPAIVIRPKNAVSSANQRTCILVKLDLLVGCKSKADNLKLLSIAKQKLGNSYDIKEVTGINPRIRLVGMSKAYSEEQINSYLLKSNPEVFCGDVECRVLKTYPTKKNNNVYQAEIQLDRISYERAMKGEHLFVGYDSCIIFDAVEVSRCFKCNEFHHSSVSCQNEISCPVCSGKHEVKQCKSTVKKCSNCVKLNIKSDLNVSTAHAVWDKTLSETWLDSDINDREVFPGNYSVYRSDRNFSAIGLKRGGGVAVPVRNDFKSSSVDLGACPSFNNINPKIDILVIKIAIQYSNIYVISLYIPPQISVSDYETFVEAIQSLDVLHGSSIFIVGDFNVTSYAVCLDSNISNGFTNSLNALAGFFNAEQYNYVHNENGNLLDLVFSNAICFEEHATDPLVYEDIHHPALIVTAKNLPVDKKNDVLYSNFVGNYNFRKANFQLLYEMIMNINWANLESMTNVELACELLYSEIYKILDYCVPKVKRIYTHKYPPWYSRHLIQILKQKSVAFRRFKQTGNIRNQVEFQKLRSELKTQASAVYRHYIQSLESDISKNSSTFWSFVNRKTNNHSIPKDMLYNGQSMTNPEDISGAFAEYFGSTCDLICKTRHFSMILLNTGVFRIREHGGSQTTSLSDIEGMQLCTCVKNLPGVLLLYGENRACETTRFTVHCIYFGYPNLGHIKILN